MAQERERLCGRGRRISDYRHDRFGQEDRTETTTKKCKTEQKLKKVKKRICSEVTIKVWGVGNHVFSPEEEKERLQWEGFAEKKSLE